MSDLSSERRRKMKILAERASPQSQLYLRDYGTAVRQQDRGKLEYAGLTDIAHELLAYIADCENGTYHVRKR